mmetsp:Transcript_2117/g.7275  ORF Transcript_2117/g.7275 Transcript_2117/m.7275 type:complete len:114 (+) Transcript_2117:608-949(+)
MANPERPVRFRVRLQTSDRKKLGLDTTALLPPAQRGKGALWISCVSAGGLVAAWNAEHRQRQIRGGDYIIEVNGTRGSPDELYTAIAKATTLDLTILRIPLAAGDADSDQDVS